MQRRPCQEGQRDAAGYTTTVGNRTTAALGLTYTYDPEGNRASQTETATSRVTTYAYDFRNRLTGVTITDSSSAVIGQATYTYDPLDRRVRVVVDTDGAGPNAPQTTATVYDGINPYATFDGASALRTRYLHGPAVDWLLARTSAAGDTAWYLTDRLGSVRDLASTAGTVIDHIAYDGFGRVLSETSPANGDDFKFTGRVRDPLTGLQYNRGRYYDAALGAWTQEDPSGFTGGDPDLYRYVGNSPTNAIDPTGLEGWGGWLGRQARAAGDYLGRSVSQVVLGNYTDEVTALGTAGQIGTGLIGVDLPGDVRDIFHDITHWEWSLKHAGKTTLDTAGLLPFVGALKYGDEVAALAKGASKADEIADAAKGASKAGTAADTAKACPTPSTPRTAGYGDLTGELRGTGEQANHLNQNAAYRDIIPENEGLAVGMRGNAFTEPGTPHYQFHQSLEGFWNQFRRGGSRFGQTPTNAEYGQALQQALESSGFSPAQAAELAAQAASQRAVSGLLERAPVPRIPGRINQRR